MASSVKEYKIDRNILDKVFLDHLFSSLAPSTPYLGDLGYYGEISAVFVTVSASVASHADVLRGSSRVPAPRGAGTRDEPSKNVCVRLQQARIINGA